MKQFSIITVSILFAQLLSAQSFDGTWLGRLEMGIELRLAFTFKTMPNGKVTATWQSPDQAKDILPTDTCYINSDSIYTTAKRFGVSFKGKLIDNNTIDGVFTQGVDINLVLKKTDSIAELQRPQTPIPPFNYLNKDVRFAHKDSSWKLAGTLSWPKPEPGVDYIKSPTYPAVILVSGSGPQDRDETLLGHKPFAVIADYLVKKGFAVLRYDDRGVGSSGGKFETATTADFADDAGAALDFLKTQEMIDTKHLGIIGHSEGGMIAPIVAAQRSDVHSIVLLAGPGVPILQLMEEQVEAVALSSGETAPIVNGSKEIFRLVASMLVKEKDSAKQLNKGVEILEQWAGKQTSQLLDSMELNSAEKRKGYVMQQVKAMSTPWFSYFLAFNPEKYLARLQSNVLAINGSKDVQVLPTSNLAGIRAALKKSKAAQFDVIELPGLNHLFQRCKTCSPAEYAKIEETFAPEALELIANWLLQYGR